MQWMQYLWVFTYVYMLTYLDGVSGINFYAIRCSVFWTTLTCSSLKTVVRPILKVFLEC